MYLMLSITCNKVIVVAISIIMALLGAKINIHFPWHIEVAMVAQIFMVFGYLAKEYGLMKKMTKIKCRIRIVIPVLYMGLVILDKVFINKKYDLHMSEYGGGIVIYIILAFMGIVSTLSLLKYIPNKRVITRIGENSLIFYAFQYSVIKILNIVFSRCGFEKVLRLNVLTRCMATILYTIICMVICYSLALLINNNIP